MGISVQSTIKLNIDGQEIVLTHDQALSLWAGLCKALGKPQQAITYPPGVRTPMINDQFPSQPRPWTSETPPVWGGTVNHPHDLTQAVWNWNEKENRFETKDGITITSTGDISWK